MHGFIFIFMIGLALGMGALGLSFPERMTVWTALVILVFGFNAILIGLDRVRQAPPSPEQRRDFWTCIAMLLVTFGGGFFVHPLFFATLYVWVAWANYREHGHIFKSFASTPPPRPVRR